MEDLVPAKGRSIKPDYKTLLINPVNNGAPFWCAVISIWRKIRRETTDGNRLSFEGFVLGFSIAALVESNRRACIRRTLSGGRRQLPIVRRNTAGRWPFWGQSICRFCANCRMTMRRIGSSPHNRMNLYRSSKSRNRFDRSQPPDSTAGLPDNHILTGIARRESP